MHCCFGTFECKNEGFRYYYMSSESRDEGFNLIMWPLVIRIDSKMTKVCLWP